MTELLAHWVHDWEPVIFQFGDRLAVRWYGLAYVAGFLVAWLLLSLYYKKGRSPLEPARQETLFIAMLIGVMLGGRLGYMLLYSFDTLASDPLSLLRVWEGGMASHGGFIGVGLAILWCARKWQLPFGRIADLICTIASPGLFFGRIANFINGELWGKVSDVPWAVIFPKSAEYGTAVSQIPARHPSQIYEALLEGLLLFAYIQWRFWKFPQLTQKYIGQLAGEYLILYSLLRAFGELFRAPDAGLILGLNRGIFYSLFLVLVGAVLIWRARKQAAL